MALAESLDVKDLGELNHFLGVKIVQNHKAGLVRLVHGTAITWQSKKQLCVALSSAEYVALAGAAQEAVWSKQLNEDLTGKSEAVMIHEDN